MYQHLIVAPFHDWRKCYREGFRTRDVHLTDALARGGLFEKVLVVNRPITRLELAFRGEKRAPVREPQFGGDTWHVFQDRACYVFEHFDPGYFGQAFHGRSWFAKAYGSAAMAADLLEAVRQLGMRAAVALLMNIRSQRLAQNLSSSGIPVAFDAWDDWYRFPFRAKEQRQIAESYAAFATVAPVWFTNSQRNQLEFKRRYGIASIVVPNGVDPERFQRSFQEPGAYRRIPKPRAFYGGKITHLFDADLFNEVTCLLPQINFIVAGQVSDRTVWGKVNRDLHNVHYVGDVHYDEYPAYVATSDVCIAPYVREERSHGGDSIKLYEYVAAHRRVVATSGNSSGELLEAVATADSAETFAREIVIAIECKKEHPRMDLSGCSWVQRARTVAGHLKAMSRAVA